MNTGNQINGKPALTTTQIGKVLGFHLSVRFIEDVLKVPADEKTKSSTMWLASKLRYIGYQLSQYAYGIEAEAHEILEEEYPTKRGDL